MSVRVAWLTDLHLNFVEDEYRRAALAEEIEATEADALLIGGDIGEADSFADYLDELAAAVRAPVYFVLGNHDYYRGAISEVRAAARALSRQCDDLTWLPDAGVVELGPRTALVGHGGWGDGRAGDFLSSTVVLNDYLLIRELQSTHDFPEQGPVLTPRLLEKLHSLGDEAAEHFRNVLPDALDAYQKVIALMHVPPFLEACWHEGRLSDHDWAPHFVCSAAGEALVEIMTRRPDRELTVLCGHTHGFGEAQILSNLRVLTGGATYGEPAVQRVLTVD